MTELREVFEMATRQTEPDLDSWKQQESRQRRSARNRKVGALVVAAMIAVGLATVVWVSRTDQGSKVGTNPPSLARQSVGPSTTVASELGPQHRYVVSLDGAKLQQVTGLPTDAIGLSLSTDAAKIAFVTGVGGVNTIATIGTDGRGMQPLKPGAQPAFSPDATRIAFVRDGDIYVMNADGSAEQRLTTDPNDDEFPQWSPDGKTIVYDNLGSGLPSSSGYSDTSVIMTVPSTGGTPTQIASRQQSSEPSFSPDGSQIVFRSHAAIWIMNADGTGAHRIIDNTEGTVDVPRWSPDGTKIAFNDYTAAYRVNSDLGADYGNWPVELVKVYDVKTGVIKGVGQLGVLTFWNTPQWLPSSHQLLLNAVQKP